MYNKKHLLSAIKPLTFFSSWIYFNSFSVRNDEIIVSKFKAIASVVYIVVCFIVKYLRMIWYSYPGYEQTIVNISSCFIMTFWLASSLNCLVEGRSIARVWNEILPLVRFITEDSFYRKSFRLTFFQMIGFNAAYALYIFMYYYFYPEDFKSIYSCLENVIDYSILFHFGGTEALFYNCLHLGTKLVSLANEELMKLRRIEYYNDRKRWKGLEFIKVEKVEQLRSQLKMIRGDDLTPLVEIYERLCWCYEELNECFGVSLTASCLNNLMQMTLSCYFMAKHGWVAVRLFSVWFSYCFLFEWNLVRACENFVREAKKTGHIIDLVVTDASSQVLKNAVKRFSRHLLHRPMKFTACRLFDLNYRLLYSVVTNIITYLVVVMQFDNSRHVATM